MLNNPVSMLQGWGKFVPLTPTPRYNRLHQSQTSSGEPQMMHSTPSGMYGEKKNFEFKVGRGCV